jgi:hypothetical protein
VRLGTASDGRALERGRPGALAVIGASVLAGASVVLVLRRLRRTDRNDVARSGSGRSLRDRLGDVVEEAHVLSVRLGDASQVVGETVKTVAEGSMMDVDDASAVRTA